jgi:hypothetical protein
VIKLTFSCSWGRARLTFAARTLLKNPGFTVAVAVSVALAIAANSTVFGIVNGLLLGALPVREPSRLVSLNQGNSFSYLDYIDYRDQSSQVFEGITAHFPFIPANLGGAGEPERIWGQVAQLLLGSRRQALSRTGFHASGGPRRRSQPCRRARQRIVAAPFCGFAGSRRPASYPQRPELHGRRSHAARIPRHGPGGCKEAETTLC